MLILELTQTSDHSAVGNATMALFLQPVFQLTWSLFITRFAFINAKYAILNFNTVKTWVSTRKNIKLMTKRNLCWIQIEEENKIKNNQISIELNI